MQNKAPLFFAEWTIEYEKIKSHHETFLLQLSFCFQFLIYFNIITIGYQVRQLLYPPYTDNRGSWDMLIFSKLQQVSWKGFDRFALPRSVL